MQQNVMIGLTHNADGTPRIRESRLIKVGIGIPRGKGLRVFIHPTDKATPWYVMEGYYDGKSFKERGYRFATRAEAEASYRDKYDKAPECAYPRKLKFFTFSKPVVNDKGGEVYEPDFDCIEAYGPTPTRIDILFLNPDAYRGGYQMWSATELRCKGDGVDALRAVSMGDAKDPAVIAAKARGERYFPIIGGCKTKGCQYAESRECKPGCTLSFQLAKTVRIGGTAHFHTTGYESSADIFSSLHVIKSVVELATGRTIAGLQAVLAMRPYVTKPDGLKAQTQYAVHIELPLRVEQNLQAQLMASVWDAPKQIAAPEVESLLAAEEDSGADDSGVEEGPVSAQAMDAEFYEAVEEAAAPPQAPAAQATEKKTASIGARLKARPLRAPDEKPMWATESEMRADFRDVRAKIPADAFHAILSNHNTPILELALNQQSWDCYRDLLKMAGDGPMQPAKNEDIF